LSGQYITKTAEISVFKYMLTGVDDSALDLAKLDPIQPLRQAAQLELLDRQVREIDREIAEEDQDPDELAKLDTALDAELSQSFQVQAIAEIGYRRMTGSRRELRREYEEAQDRVDEIDTLQARFSLLAEHYQSDEQRLASIIEAGAFFMLEESGSCPVCGASPEHHRPHFACEGNVSEIVAAASAEASELTARRAELQLTVRGLARLSRKSGWRTFTK
jgi:hypothetical protein